MEISFNDGTKAPVDVNVNALTLFKLQKDGVIGRDFLSGLMKQDAQAPDLVSMLTGVYIAYRQANQKEFIKFEEFLEKYEADVETDMQIYLAIVSRRARDKFQKGFLKQAVKKAAK